MLTLLADWVFVLHGVFVVLALPSSVLAYLGYYRGKQMLWYLHNLAMGIMVTGRAFLGQCPLVALEQALRHRAGERMPYTDSYVVFMIRSVTGVAPPAGSVMVMSAAVAVLSVAAIVRHRGQAAERTPAPEPVRVG
ncbi:MAG: DUF2784 domain-containing protein [Chloroflexi bacterium]|nr:MAG: DUF2784 domain-containing protein [Chloroflexota bacterium]